MSNPVVSESAVLKPLLPAHLSEKYEPQWPVFELANAIVTDQAGAVANLFSASEENLLVLSGELVQKKDQARQYKHGIRKKAVFVEVNPVGRYAFGSDETGNIQIWAAGRSGWFELVPSLEYAAIYAEMTEAVQLWHAVVDSTKLQNATARDIFVPPLRPTKRRKDARARPADEVYRRHAEFLIEQMGKSLASWSRKPLYQYLLKLQKDATTKPSPEPIVEPPTKQSMTARTRELKRRGRPPRTEVVEPPRTPVKKERPARTPVDDLKRIETEGAVLWKFILRGSERWENARPEIITMQIVGWMLHQVFIFEDTEQAINYTRFQCPYLLKVMRDRRLQRTWGKSPFYNDLLNTVLSQRLIGKMAKLVLQVREYEVGGDLAKGGFEVYASSDEDIQRHVTKSALRPKAAGKGKLGKGKSYTGGKNAEEEEQSSSGSRTPKKRKVGVEDEGVRRSKRNKTEIISLLTDESSAAESENGQAEDNSDDTESSEEERKVENQQAGEKALPLRWKSSNAKSNPSEGSETAPVIVKGPTLDPQPNAPGDVWHCTVLGCMRTIYGASGKLGKRLIDDHLYEHRAQEDGAPQYDVVMNETKKTNLPVSNLIKKIREYAAAKELAIAMASADTNGSL